MSVTRLVFVCNEDALDVTKLSGTPAFMVAALRRRFPNLVVEREPWPLWARKVRDGVLKVTGGGWTPIYWPWLNRALAFRLRRRHPAAAFVVPVAANLVAALARTNPVLNLSDAVRAYLVGPYYTPFERMDARHARLADDVERDSLAYAGHSSFSSPWAARGAVALYGADPARVSVVPWGCNLDFIAPRGPWRREATCRLLFIGMDWTRKGGDIALATARALAARGFDFTLDLVGVAPPAGTNLPAQIRVAGVLRKSDPADSARLDALLDEASFLLLPTRADCTPMVFAEANAYGIPAITCDVGGVTGVVDDGANGMVLPADAGPDALAETIMSVWNDPDRYVQMRAEARRHYEERLNWTAWADALAPVVARMLTAR